MKEAEDLLRILNGFRDDLNAFHRGLMDMGLWDELNMIAESDERIAKVLDEVAGALLMVAGRMKRDLGY